MLSTGADSSPGARVAPRGRAVWFDVRVWGWLPAIGLIGLFIVVPAGWAVYASLTDVTLFSGSNVAFIGLENYRALWNDPNIRTVIGNTLVFVAGSAVAGQLTIGLLLALLISSARRRGFRLAQVAYVSALLAWVSPAMLVGFIWARLFTADGGTVNALIEVAGGNGVDLLGRHPLAMVIAADIWHGVAFAMLCLLGALEAIPKHVYEAASLDGASAFRGLRDHTLPLLRPTLTLVGLMSTMTALGSFLIILLLTGGGPAAPESTTLSLYAFRAAFERGSVGYGSAVAVLMVSINVVFGTVFLLAARKR